MRLFEPHSQSLTISAQYMSPRKPQQNSRGYAPSTLTAAPTRAAVTLGNMRSWTVVPSLIVTSPDAMKVGDREKGSNTYRLYLILSHSSSIRQSRQRWGTGTSIVRRGIPRMLQMFSMGRCIENSANRRLPQMVRRISIGISRITEILRSGYPSMALPHSNAGATRHGQSYSSTTTFPPTSELTLITSSAMGSSQAPSHQRMSTPFLFPFMKSSHGYPMGWTTRSICQRRNFSYCVRT